MSETKRQDKFQGVVNIEDVESKIVRIRNVDVIADVDVAELYGLQTKEVNQAVRNNIDKFPPGYMFTLTINVLRELRSKFLTTNVSVMSRNSTKVFTEREKQQTFLCEGICPGAAKNRQ